MEDARNYFLQWPEVKIHASFGLSGPGYSQVPILEAVCAIWIFDNLEVKTEARFGLRSPSYLLGPVLEAEIDPIEAVVDPKS